MGRGLERKAGLAECLVAADGWFAETFMAGSQKYYQKKKSYAGLIALGLTFVVIILLLTLVVVSINKLAGVNLKVVTVPDVKGLALADAEGRLAQVGLKLHQGDGLYSDEVATDRVAAQMPEASTQVKEGREIEVNLSLGPTTYIVPDLRGKELDEAQDVLASMHLSLGTVEKILTQGSSRGRVLNQYPAPGKKVSNAFKIDLYVSENKIDVTVKVPQVAGRKLSEAEEILNNANLVLAGVTYIYQEGSKPGFVVEQDPAAQTELTLGDSVKLVVCVPQELKQALTKSFTVHVKVPQGPSQQRVTVSVSDQLGDHQVLDEKHKPGDEVSQKVSVQGDATIRVYFDGKLIREDNV